jgi:hypothetical protein
MMRGRWFATSVACVSLLALSAPVAGAMAARNIPGGTYKGRVAVSVVEINGALGKGIGSTKLSLKVSHSVVSGMRIGPVPEECGGLKLRTPPLSGFPRVNLKKEKLFNPSDALLSVEFTQSPLNATASNPWVLFGVPVFDGGTAVVDLAGSFIAGHFEGAPGGFGVFVETNDRGELGPPGPDGLFNACGVRAESFFLRRVGAKKKHHGRH